MTPKVQFYEFANNSALSSSDTPLQGLGFVSENDYLALLQQAEQMKAALDALTEQLVDAFGDGYYDGFLDGARHHEANDCSTDPKYLGEEALRCSEIAETEKSTRLGISDKKKRLVEREVQSHRNGFIEGARHWCSDHDLDSLDNEIEQSADRYAESVESKLMSDDDN